MQGVFPFAGQRESLLYLILGLNSP